MTCTKDVQTKLGQVNDMQENSPNLIEMILKSRTEIKIVDFSKPTIQKYVFGLLGEAIGTTSYSFI